MRAEHDHISLTDALAMTRTSAGRTLLELSRVDEHHRGVLLVFLRHLGCTFARESIHDVAKARADIQAAGVRLVLVHMASTDADAVALFAKSGVGDLPRVADPAQALYRAFELGRGTTSQLFGAKCVVRGVPALLRGHGVGKPVGDPLQMPGAFLVRDGVIARAFRHDSIADRPDYAALAKD